jgi:hypothetical protein
VVMILHAASAPPNATTRSIPDCERSDKGRDDHRFFHFGVFDGSYGAS